MTPPAADEAPGPDTAPMARSSFTTSRRRITGLRRAAQRLGSNEASTAAEAVRWMLGMQAQDFPGAKWSVGLRQAGATEIGVEAACDAGEIVRSWPLRGTLHLVAADDLAWLLELTAPRALASAATRRAALGITDADVDRARTIALDMLTGRRTMARETLLATFDSGGVSTEGQRGYHLLWYLAQTGTLVLGASDGRGQTFALLDDWVPDPRRLDRDEALGELALRYYRSHGPATVRDLVRWSGLTVRDVRRGLAIAGDRLTGLEADGVAYHLAPETLELSTPPDVRVHLLPGFDEYVLGYADRTAALAPEHADAIVPGGNGMFKPTIVADGEVVGTWRRTVTTRDTLIEAAPFGRLTAEVLEGLGEAARAYGAFVGRPVRVMTGAGSWALGGDGSQT